MSITSRIICMVAYILLAPFVGGLLDGCDRVLSARMQGRKGPKLLQPFYDIYKLWKKQMLKTNGFQLLLLASYLFFVVLSGSLLFGGFDMLMCFFALSTSAMFMVLASSATHSPFAAVGTHRELAQMMSYEPMELLTAVGFYLAVNSFQVSDIVSSSVPAIVYAPGFFIGFVFILTIKFRKSPFDISTSHHAHQEVVKGLTQEFIGREYAMVEVAEWYEQVFLYAIIALFFITSNPISYVWAILAVAVVFFLEVLIDNTSARVKWQLMVKLAWGVTIIAGGLNLYILELIAK